jgi:hypothetical protein
VAGIAKGRPRFVRDLCVEKALLVHHVAKNLFEATEHLRSKRQSQFQVGAVRAQSFAELGVVDLFGAVDVDAGDVSWPSTGRPRMPVSLSSRWWPNVIEQARRRETAAANRMEVAAFMSGPFRA